MSMRPPDVKSPLHHPEVEAVTDERIWEQAAILIARLERISADSIWAHRSSGLRGSLLRAVDEWKNRGITLEKVPDSHNIEQLDHLILDGYYLLEKAAQEY